MEIKRTFKIAKVNRMYELSSEIAKKYNLPVGRIMRLCKLKGIQHIEDTFRKVEASDAPNKVGYFINQTKQ